MPAPGVTDPMSRFRPVIALCALSLCASATLAQGTTPAVSTVVAFSISNPVGNLIRGTDGAFYGVVLPVTNVTTGLIYRAAADGSDIRTLYQLSNVNDGVSPQAGLVLGTDGMLYGSTKFGRGNEVGSTGTIFRIAQDGTGFTVIHRFDVATGTNPNLSPKNQQGAYLEGELIEGSDTFLYGVAAAGGPEGTGTVFRVSRDGATFTRLYSFGPDTDTTNSGLIVTADGAAPLAPLVQVDGYLYGTTSVGGTFGRGVIFRLQLDGTGFKVLKHFPVTTNDTTTGLPENADGAIPLAGLTDGNDGFLYGVTSVGGVNGQGVVFALDLALVGTGNDADLPAAYDVIHEFSGNNGTRPAAELLLGTDGKLYGTTTAGGETSGGQASTFGTFFSIERTGANFKRLHSFDNQVGVQPASRPVQVGADRFAGTLQNGGRCGYGAIWNYSGAGETVAGSTRCGRGGGNNNNGGGSAGLGWLALLGALGLFRRRSC
jgi:uncharacterized repeat protein (TIGR03803 family)